MNEQPKALRSASCTSKAHKNLQGVFPIMIGFVTFGHLLCIGDHAQEAAKGG